VSSPLIYDGLLYFFQHINALITCLDAATGQSHFVQERLEGVTTVYASPIGVNNRVYVVGREGATVVLEKSKELKVLARNTLDDGFDASPAVVGNELFLRGRSKLYCITETASNR
jgi:outer membrane protein assembly factor BamB